MEFRFRTHVNVGPLGRMYFPDTGETYSLGSVTFQQDWSDDYYKKEVREDSTLPPSSCKITHESRSPLCFSSQDGVLAAEGHPVQDQGSITSGQWNACRTRKGSGARNSENAELYWELLAASNPFRPEFSIPVALKELVDITQLFKIAANSFASFAGSAYLNYKFGWVQFVDDLRVLASITTALERRIKEIQSLSKQGGIRRKINLRSKAVTFNYPDQIVNGNWGYLLHANIHKSLSCTIHGTVRWRWKDGVILNLSKLEAFNLAVTKIFDLGGLDSQTVWNLIPFSWLVDYFTELNDFLVANLGQGIVEPYDICIVRQLRGRVSYTPVSTPGVTFSNGGFYLLTEMDRDVLTYSSFPVPNPSLLSKAQWVTIAALAASFKK